jgi:ABC-type polysaccharide/polyol phosphate export permease
MAVTIASIGMVFGIILESPIETFLPYLASGVIVWGLVSGILNEGSQAFIAAEGMIKQVPLPKLAHLIRVIWRNILTTGHNMIIFPVVLLVTGSSVNWSLLLFPVGLAILISSVAGLSLILAVTSTRFRDVPPIVNSIVTVGFYVTPVIWMPGNLGDSQLAHLLLGLNPFYHLLQVARLPLLGALPTLENWALASLSAGFFWVVAIVIYQKFNNRIAYWV